MPASRQLPIGHHLCCSPLLFTPVVPQQHIVPSGLLNLCLLAAVQITDAALQVMRNQIQLQKLVLDGCTKLTSDGLAYMQGGLPGG